MSCIQAIIVFIPMAALALASHGNISIPRPPVIQDCPPGQVGVIVQWPDRSAGTCVASPAEASAAAEDSASSTASASTSTSTTCADGQCASTTTRVTCVDGSCSTTTWNDSPTPPEPDDPGQVG